METLGPRRREGDKEHEAQSLEDYEGREEAITQDCADPSDRAGSPLRDDASQAKSPTVGSGETPLAYRAVRGGLWVAASSYWQVGFGFAAGIWLARLLPPEAFGAVTLATFFAQLLQVQNKVGLGFAFAREKEVTGEALGTFLVTVTLAALAGIALISASAPILLRFGYSSGVVMIAVAYSGIALFTDISGVGGTMLDKELRFRPSSVVQSLTFPLSYVPAFWLATHNGGAWSIVAQSATYAILSMAGIWWAVRRQLPHYWQMRWRFDGGMARRYLRFGVTVGAAGLASLLVSQLDSFLVGTYVSVRELGFYDRAYRIAQWPSLLLNTLISRTAFYTYAKLQGDRVRLQKAVSMVLWLITTGALPLSLLIFITAPDLITLAYTERWLPAAPLLRLLLVHAIARPLWENAGAFFVAIGRPKLTVQFTLVQALVLAVTGLPLTLRWGAMGTCVAVALTFIAGIALLYGALAREVKIELIETLGKPALAAALTIAGYYALNRITALSDLSVPVRLSIKSLYTLLAFFGLTLAMQPASSLERIRYVWALATKQGR